MYATGLREILSVDDTEKSAGADVAAVAAVATAAAPSPATILPALHDEAEPRTADAT